MYAVGPQMRRPLPSVVCLSSPGVHLEMRIAPQQVPDRYESAPLAEPTAHLGAAVVTCVPRAGDERH